MVVYQYTMPKLELQAHFLKIHNLTKSAYNVPTTLNVDIEAWIKVKKSIPAWSKYIREEGKEVNEKLDKVAQTIGLLFKEGKIQSNDDKPILENALSLIANNDALKVRRK
ncbi:MAG: hypothetical protein IJ604_06550 [Prevotella sp.]|nr:hypothetical protein [Prevotella sp.]